MKILSMIALLLVIGSGTVQGFDNDDECRSVSSWYTPPGPNEVHIGPVCIGMPLNRIIVIRKDDAYCAVRFTKYWTRIGKRGKEMYAAYDAYYQGDGTGDFSNANAEFKAREASLLPERGFFYPLIWQPGHAFVKCGAIDLNWFSLCGINHICFFKGVYQGDYGFSFAPTPWSDIKEVDVHDQRVQWYRYDEKRPRVNIPIDQLWDNISEKN